MALDRDLIVRTALRLLDDVGLETLSLRRLAKELDVHASALYWHFTNKQELLDEMARAIVMKAATEEVDPPADDTWQAWLAHLARAQRRAVRSHRDGVLLLIGGRPTADYQLAYLAELMDRLVRAGFSAAEAGEAFLAVSNYALGTVIAEQQRAARAATADDVRRQIQSHPGLATITRATEDADATFERGLQWLLAGMRESSPAKNL
jgi:TetR/AcrR family tetracycline transcriptional repressor